VLGGLGRAMYHPLTPLAFEDYLIHQRMLRVGVEKPKWIRTLRLSPCCHELVAWLLSERAGDEGILHAAFLHMHADTEKLWKRDTIVSTLQVTAVFSVSILGLRGCWIHAVSPVGGKF